MFSVAFGGFGNEDARLGKRAQDERQDAADRLLRRKPHHGLVHGGGAAGGLQARHLQPSGSVHVPG